MLQASIAGHSAGDLFCGLSARSIFNRRENTAGWEEHSSTMEVLVCRVWNGSDE